MIDNGNTVSKHACTSINKPRLVGQQKSSRKYSSSLSNEKNLSVMKERVETILMETSEMFCETNTMRSFEEQVEQWVQTNSPLFVMRQAKNREELLQEVSKDKYNVYWSEAIVNYFPEAEMGLCNFDWFLFLHENKLKMVKQKGINLEFASDLLKDDECIVKAAIEQNGYALAFASDRLKNKRDVVMSAVSKQGLVLEDASDSLKEDKQLVLQAVKENGLALQYASRRLRKEKDVVTAAYLQNKLSMVFAHKTMIPVLHRD